MQALKNSKVKLRRTLIVLAILAACILMPAMAHKAGYCIQTRTKVSDADKIHKAIEGAIDKYRGRIRINLPDGRELFSYAENIETIDSVLSSNPDCCRITRRGIVLSKELKIEQPELSDWVLGETLDLTQVNYPIRYTGMDGKTRKTVRPFWSLTDLCGRSSTESFLISEDDTDALTWKKKYTQEEDDLVP